MLNILECVRMCNRLPLPQKMQQYAKEEEKTLVLQKLHKKKHNNYFF